MTSPRSRIVLGSTRAGRFGDKPAHWIQEANGLFDDLACGAGALKTARDAS